MATAQLQRTPTSAVIFPNKITNEQQSLMLVKRLLAISISCITYLRGIFPECAYGTRYLDDICVKILREDKNCPGSSQLVKWMLGCYDALQKKYLRMIVLAVYTNPEDPQAISECYQFKFKYTSNGPIMDFLSQSNKSSTSPADTKKASILLIRKIYILMQNLGPLPNDVCLTMKLFYYDEVTPPDYQPPGFKDGDCDGVTFEGEPMYLNVGEVPTPFHNFRVKVTTEKEQMENIDTLLLSSKQLKTPFQKILMDKDDLEDEQEHYINDDFDIDIETKMEEQKKHPGCSELGESSLVCEEDEIMKCKESPDLSVSHNQVEQLVNKTSELVMSESKTRSGKMFQNKMANENQPVKSSKENRKRSQPESKKNVPHDFDSPSQESIPKRRKFSEPKEHL